MGDRNDFGDGLVNPRTDIEEAISSATPMILIVSRQHDIYDPLRSPVIQNKPSC